MIVSVAAASLRSCSVSPVTVTVRITSLPTTAPTVRVRATTVGEGGAVRPLLKRQERAQSRAEQRQRTPEEKHAQEESDRARVERATRRSVRLELTRSRSLVPPLSALLCAH